MKGFFALPIFISPEIRGLCATYSESGPSIVRIRCFLRPSLLATALYAPGVASGAPGGAVKGFCWKIAVAMRAVSHLLYTTKNKMV